MDVSRHAKTFSTAEVRAFFATNGYRFLCYRATFEALLEVPAKDIEKSSIAEIDTAYQQWEFGLRAMAARLGNLRLQQKEVSKWLPAHSL